MKSLDLVGIGECLVEFSAAGDNLYQVGFSGDVLNSLSAARHLGLSTGLISALGDDPFTMDLVEVLRSENIDLQYAPIVEGHPNGVYFIHVSDSAHPSFHFLRKDSAATETFTKQSLEQLIEYGKSARALLFSSIPLAVMKERERIHQFLDALHGETALCYDLNVRPALWSNRDDLIQQLDRLAKVVDVIFVTNDDDTALFGWREPSHAVQYYLRHGFRRVIFRRGGQATLVGTPEENFEVPVPKVAAVVDTTGAGDAFNAGYITALLRKHDTYECVAMGNAAAACSLDSRGGRASGITIEHVEKYYRPLVKWGTFHVPPRR
jgi:2-dehydro-3-deoxygluconokinase